jgi:hypothetical protein
MGRCHTNVGAEHAGQSGGGSSTHEPHRTAHSVTIGDRERGLTVLHRTFDEKLRRTDPILQ